MFGQLLTLFLNVVQSLGVPERDVHVKDTGRHFRVQVMEDELVQVVEIPALVQDVFHPLKAQRTLSQPSSIRSSSSVLTAQCVPFIGVV